MGRGTLAIVAIMVSPALLASRGDASDADARADGPRSAWEWMDRAYRLKAAGDLDAAASAFAAARAAGFDAQRVEVELGYLAAQHGDGVGARSHFQAAVN